MPFKRGEVVLAPFPFTEKHIVKNRPAVVISGGTYHSACPDIIVAQITSRTNAPPRPGDHQIKEWKAAGLAAPSLVRARLATLHSAVVLRRLGVMSSQDMAAFDRGLLMALELDRSR